MDGGLTLLGGGDVGPMVQPVERLTELIAPKLENVDFRFGQCERTYSNYPSSTFPRWATIPSGAHSLLSPEYAEIFRAAKIDVTSMASNHALDWGHPPFLDTLDRFDEMGVAVVGGGRTEAEARKPAILEKDGVRIAILAYTCQLRDGWSAAGDVPGLAGIRVRTSYEAVDFQPAVPPKIHSWCYPEDVEAAVADVEKIRDEVDAVVVSLHWGVSHLPKLIAEYQQPLAHALMDAGVSVILGHGPHSLRAVEQYNGGVCFYSVGCFLTTGNLHYKDWPAHARWGLYWYRPPSPDSLYMFPDDCKPAVLAQLEFSKSGLERAAMVPMVINDLAQPEPLTADDQRFTDLYDTMEWVSDQYPHRFAVEGDDIVVGLD